MSAGITDSPDRSVAEHVRRYLATDGRDGYLEGGVPSLVLTVTGRTTGRRRRTALFYGVDGDRYVLVASGSAVTATHPEWYRNLVADPAVEVRIKGERFAATARTVQGAERQRLWDLMTGLAPVYHAYAERSPRTIPVVVLERT
jgi:deazaflavin-dependent oxidoreductase (nitroreductase family)